MRSKDCWALSAASIIFASVSSNTLQVDSIKSAILAICAVQRWCRGFSPLLIYARRAPVEFASRLTFLPALNALLNGLSATAILSGIFFISRRRITAHRNSMLVAFCFSSLFLVSYITITPSTARPTTRSALAPLALPRHSGLAHFAFGSRSSVGSSDIPPVAHRPVHSAQRIARFTFPIWLYVSVTGVVVFLMLHAALRNTAAKPVSCLSWPRFVNRPGHARRGCPFSELQLRTRTGQHRGHRAGRCQHH